MQTDNNYTGCYRPTPKRTIRFFLAVILFLTLIITTSLRAQDFWDSIPYPDTVRKIFSISLLGSDTVMIGTDLTRRFNGGIYLSPNKGETWEFIGPYRVTPYTILKGRGDTLFAGGSGGIWRSPDWGNAWERVWISHNNVVSLHETQNRRLYAGYWGGVVRSLDNGDIWDTSLHKSGLVIRAITSDSDGIIYAAGRCYGGQYENFYYSEDNGESFTGIPTPGIGNIRSLQVNSMEELFAGDLFAGLFKSNDGGYSWEAVVDNRSIRDIIITENDEVFLGCDNDYGFSGGVLFSPDKGIYWDDITYNIGNKYVKKLARSVDCYIYEVSNAGYSILGHSLNKSANQFVAINTINETSLTVFPNPCISKLTILLKDDFKGHGIVYSLININGESSICGKFNKNQNIDSFEIDTDTVVPGIYILCLKVNDHIYSKKIIIN